MARQAAGGGMAEEIKNYVERIATIPPQSLLAGELKGLRQSWKRLRDDAAKKENKTHQKRLIAQLTAMGREDLTK